MSCSTSRLIFDCHIKIDPQGYYHANSQENCFTHFYSRPEFAGNARYCPDWRYWFEQFRNFRYIKILPHIFKTLYKGPQSTALRAKFKLAIKYLSCIYKLYYGIGSNFLVSVENWNQIFGIGVGINDWNQYHYFLTNTFNQQHYLNF